MLDEKSQLTARLMDYFTRRGFADTTLRPLAADIGSSARMLIYHFGSKERLLAEVLKAMQIELRKSLARLLDQPARSGVRHPPLRRMWDWAIEPENLARLKLLYELQILAASHPELYRGYLQRESEDWLDFAMSAMSPERRDPRFAAVCIAVFDGLLLDVITGGDTRQATRALDKFIEIATVTPSNKPARAGRKAARRNER